MADALELKLAIDGDTLRVSVTNRGEEALRLWDRNNSWGWSMFALEVSPPDEQVWSELAPRPVRHTRNVPRARVVSAGGSSIYELRPGDPSWDGTDALGESSRGPLRVRVRLRVPESPEAREQDVFVGEAVSEPVTSSPPHAWLGDPPIQSR